MKKNVLVSIITVVFNNKDYIASAIESVLSQEYKNIEYIIIDGKSTDGTIEIIKKYGNKIYKFISESDKGIYDAMNKGLGIASGEIIGILNSDDFYKNKKVINWIVESMECERAEVCWGDLVYVDKQNTDKVVRFWKSSKYEEGKFKTGWVPPHPTFFVRKEIYKRYGLFNLDFLIAADYEIMLRFLEKYSVKSCYIPKIMIKMRMGGKSNKSLFNVMKGAEECYKAWKINNLKINPLIPLVFRPLNKLPQYWNHYRYKINQ